MADMLVRSEIAGSVWQVLVKVGDTIEAEVPLVVLESMKMEIPVMSYESGVVTEIFVSVGGAVSEGDAVLSIRT